MSPKSLSYYKHLLRCKKKAESIGLWGDVFGSHVLTAFFKSNAVRNYRLPLIFRKIVSIESQNRWIVGLCSHSSQSENNREILQQILRWKEKSLFGLPSSVVDELQNEFPALCDTSEQCKTRWKEITQQHKWTGIEYAKNLVKKSIKAVFRNNEQSCCKVYLKNVPEDSGPYKGTLPETRLCHYLNAKLQEENESKQNITLGCLSWTEGNYGEGKLQVRNERFELPLLNISSLFLFFISFLYVWLHCLSNERKSERLSWFSFPQLVMALHAYFSSRNKLPDYLFSTNQDTYRCELYRLVLAWKGVRNVMLPYSTNEGPYNREDVVMSEYHEGALFNWPEIWCWNESHAKWAFDLGANRVKVYGAIPFTDQLEEVPDLPSRSFAVFDVQPYRDTVYAVRFGRTSGISCFESTSVFFQELVDLCMENDLYMILKRKRDVGNNLNVQYRKLLNQLKETGRVIEIAPGVSAERLIQATKVSVSYPFTSTALVAQEIGKACCYFDPSLDLNNPHAGAHGVSLIQNKAVLKDWLLQYY